MLLMKVLIVALALVAISDAQACAPNFCASVKCDTRLTANSCERSGGVFKRKGGICGCCDACPRKLAPNANCQATLLRGGAPPTVSCPNGFYCNRTTVRCQRA
ncbi:hypothetical protein HDE_09701 [Halotydeus destructor]|nr:hypothetical protein HDE_09701 [Halotydeus destructor]